MSKGLLATFHLDYVLLEKTASREGLFGNLEVVREVTQIRNRIDNSVVNPLKRGIDWSTEIS